jgi:hypothetical protein
MEIQGTRMKRIERIFIISQYTNTISVLIRLIRVIRVPPSFAPAKKKIRTNPPNPCHQRSHLLRKQKEKDPC